ncbi:MAG: hypothetical protein AAGC66_13530 [Leifsonia sp.]
MQSAFGGGALAAVARADRAEAAAVVASDPSRHGGKVYDLVGTPITAADVAGRLGVLHRTVSLSEYREQLLGHEGLLPFQPPMLASIAPSVRHGLLGRTGLDLAELLGRDPVRAVLSAAEAAAVSRPERATRARACRDTPRCVEGTDVDVAQGWCSGWCATTCGSQKIGWSGTRNGGLSRRTSGYRPSRGCRWFPLIWGQREKNPKTQHVVE